MYVNHRVYCHPGGLALGLQVYKLFTSSIPTLKPLLHKKRNVSLPPSTVFLAALQMRCKNSDTQLGTARILCGWALRGYLVVEHCRDTLRLGSVRILSGWALQGYLVVAHLSQLPSRARTTSTLKSNNTTARVGNNTYIGP